MTFTEVKGHNNKPFSIATKLGRKSSWCKFWMTVTFMEVKGQHRSNTVNNICTTYILVSRWGLGPKVCMYHFGCGMNWIKGYYMIVKVKNETFWFSTYSMEMHSFTSSSFIICLWGETFGSRTILFMNLLVKIYKKRYDRPNETLNNRLFQLCVLSCILFIQKSSPYFKAVTDSNLTRLLLRKKNKQTNKQTQKQKQKEKKNKQTNVFRSGLPICHELWDIAAFFLALSGRQMGCLYESPSSYRAFSWNTWTRFTKG